MISASAASAAGSIEVQTPSLDFGRAVLSAGNHITKDVELVNATSSTLQLTSMQLAGASSTSLRASPTGRLAAVSLSAEGVHAETLTLNPAPLNFTSTPLGTSSQAQTVTLTNGAARMLIGGLSLGGTAPHDFAIGHDGCTGTDLAPHASCTFDVHFTPSQAGARGATVTVEGATIGNSYPTLTLSGVGSALPAAPSTPAGATLPTTTTFTSTTSTTTPPTTTPTCAARPFYTLTLRTPHGSRQAQLKVT